MTMPRDPSLTIPSSSTTQLRDAPMGFARSFLGREAELAALQNAATKRPILILWGPAGVGKTRIGLEATSRLLVAGDFERAGFCALSAADTGEDIVAHVVRALNAPIRARNVDAALAALTRWLTDRAVLIVFDNAQATLDDTLTLARRLVAASPKSRVIITSRHAANEANDSSESPQRIASFHIDPLSVDAGVALFQARAEHLEQVPPKLLEAIIERLDGLPLSIELAAARLPTYSCAQLLERLDNQLETLQDFDDRCGKWEATLTRSLDASWPLLDEAERAALSQSSAFLADFSLDAAEAILALPHSAAVDRVIHGLIRKSLIYPVARPEDARQRFRLYEGVREYAARRLNPNQKDALINRFVAYFAERLAAHSRGFYSPKMDTHCEAMHDEFANARFALEHAHAVPQHAARLARGLLQFVRIAAPYRDLRPLVAQTLAHLNAREDADPAALSEVLIVMAKLEASRTETHRALACAERAAQIAQTHALAAPFAEAKTLLGFLNIRFQRTDEAEAHLRQAEHALDGKGLHRLSGALHTDFGHIYLQRGDPEQAHAHFRQALALHQLCNNPRFASNALFNLGAVECARGRFEQALSRFEKAYEQWDSWNDQHHLGVALLCIGQCNLALGRRAHARRVLESAAQVLANLDEPILQAEMSSWLALSYAADNEAGMAAARSDEAIGLCELFRSDEQKITYLAHRVLIEFADAQSQAARATLERADVLASNTADGPHHAALAIARQVATRMDHCAPDSSERAPLQTNAIAHHEVILFAAVAGHFLNGYLDAKTRAEKTRVLTVATPQADWFEWDGTRADLSRRDAARRILTRLVQARVEQPGEPLTKDAIIAAGWPGAVLHPDAAASRIYTAIRKLRDDGLREVLLTRDGGYMLSPAVSITRVAPVVGDASA